MLQNQNRKVNCAEGMSCLGLAVLAFLLVNPFVSSPANAMEGENEENSSSVNSQSNEDAGIMPLADIPSTVGISFSPASGSTALTPTTAAGQSAQVNVLASVNVSNSGGYAVYLKGSSVNLVGQKDSNNVIAGTSAAKTYDDMDVNTWGYSASEGTTVPEGAVYKAVSVSGHGDKLVENTNKKITSDTKNIMLSFAAKVNDQKPADTYKNTITMSVVSSPLQTTLTDIANMQDMTTAICNASTIYETKQLRDVRDGKYYWVTKLADNNCWMTQNLDLDLTYGLAGADAGTGVLLIPETSDVKEAWIPSNVKSAAEGHTDKNLFEPTATIADASTILPDHLGQRSWNLGNYRIINPMAPNNCGTQRNDLAQCPEQFTAYSTPTTQNNAELAHYIVGNHYQWNAATAGTGEAATEEQATGSICPKGWKLPGSNNSFNSLIEASSIGSDVGKLASAPLYFVRNGMVWQDSDLLAYAGLNGRYWLSFQGTEVTHALGLVFNDADFIDSAYSSAKHAGYSVRCLAR